MEKVYIVYSEALHHDSTYRDMVEVFRSKDDAEACIETSARDFEKAVDNGDFEEEGTFERRYDFGEADLAIVSDQDYYESWIIYEREVK